MPLTKQVAYSKKITLPSGYKTLALYDKNNKIIEYRVCKEKKDGHFSCIRGALHPVERAKLAKKIGIDIRTNKPFTNKPVKIKIYDSPLKTKRYLAVFTLDSGKQKKINFGLKNPKIGTYIDHNNDKIKQNYIKRHLANENWNEPMNAGSLARWLLWNKKSLDASLKDFIKRFKIYE